MNKNYYDILNNILKKNEGIITRKEALENNIPSMFFSRFIKKNNLNQVKQGIYMTKEYVMDELYFLQKRYPKAIFSGITAMYLLNLTDRIPEKIEISIPVNYRIRKESFKNVITHIEKNNDIYLSENCKAETIFGNEVNCFSNEKTIVEMIRKRDNYDSEMFKKAIQLYLKKDDKNISLLLQYAKKRNIEKKVYEIMEIIGDEYQ